MLEWDEAERQAFDATLHAHIAAQFSEAQLLWGDDGKRLFVAFPEGAVCTLWEPNFFFSMPSYTLDWVLARAVEGIRGQRAQLADKT